MNNKFKPDAKSRQVIQCPTLSLGSTGSAVFGLQDLLKSKGFNPGPTDGIFGPLTQAAVLAFQKSRGLVEDGIVGLKTWGALGVNCGGPPPPVHCPTLSIGSRGLPVSALQDLLRARGFNPGPSDGIFGPVTQAAVIAFQKNRGLIVDGIVGRQTWTALGATCI
ncbi:MAG: peptidoglycan-binding domain-containing protein [Eubacteriales bacterium]